MIAFLLRFLTGPLVTGIVEIIKVSQAKGLTEIQVRGEVEKLLIVTAGSLNEKQIELFKEEIQSEDPWVRRWRPTVAIAFACVLIWYAVLVPVMVDWFGFPPLRVGDKLLEWIVTLLGGTLGAFTLGRTVEKVAAAFRR